LNEAFALSSAQLCNCQAVFEAAVLLLQAVFQAAAPSYQRAVDMTASLLVSINIRLFLCCSVFLDQSTKINAP